MTQLIELAKITDLETGKSKDIKINKLSIALFKIQEDEFYAIENSCPHMGVPLDDGYLNKEKREIYCMWHDWAFDLKTGKSPSHPPMCVKTFPIILKNNTVYLELSEGVA